MMIPRLIHISLLSLPLPSTLPPQTPISTLLHWLRHAMSSSSVSVYIVVLSTYKIITGKEKAIFHLRTWLFVCIPTIRIVHTGRISNVEESDEPRSNPFAMLLCCIINVSLNCLSFKYNQRVNQALCWQILRWASHIFSKSSAEGANNLNRISQLHLRGVWYLQRARDALHVINLLYDMTKWLMPRGH